MLIDCFIFNNELDLLELRLNELDPVVDAFVLVEAPQTFSGVPKKLYFEENKSSFERFLPKIRHIVYDGPFMETQRGAQYIYQGPCHENERNQRNAIMRGLEGCSPDDVIWLSDLDEIPSPEGANHEPKFVFNMKIYIYFMNYRLDKDSGGTVSIRYGEITTPNEIMLARSWGPFLDGGWHFSYMGGASKISEKLEAICHQEYNSPEIREVDNIKRTIEQGGSIFALPNRANYEQYGWEWPADGKLLRLEEVDDTFPSYLVKNREKFDYMIADDIKKDVWSEKFV